MLSARDRFYESIGGHEDPLAEQIRQIDQSTDLDRYAEQKANDLLEALSVIRDLRERLHEACVQGLVQRASTMSTEVQEFVRTITGLALRAAEQELLNSLGDNMQSPQQD
jgi:hypothetical protein